MSSKGRNYGKPLGVRG